MPAVPTGLDPVAMYGQVYLSWSSASGALSYNVYQVTGSSYNLLDNTQNTYYLVTNLTNETQYTFAVAAVNTTGKSAYSLKLLLPPLDQTSQYSVVKVMKYTGNGTTGWELVGKASVMQYQPQDINLNKGPIIIVGSFFFYQKNSKHS